MTPPISGTKHAHQHAILSTLTRDRLVALGRALDLAIPQDAKKDDQITRLLALDGARLADFLNLFTRDELKAACRALDLDDRGRARRALAARLLNAAGEDEATIDHRFPGVRPWGDLPTPGDIVRVRHRQYLVESVHPGNRENGDATRVRLVCLDDDDPGRPLEVLWELELGARVIRPEADGLGSHIHTIDPPRHFAAYLHSLKWNAVTASDAQLLQAPFRAGIKVLDYQLTPLIKALQLPRANLFIADDVGLGKTIEAGLVLQELILRQQIEFVLIVCPPAIALQWRDEMQRRFGLSFEVMSRAFVARRRQERGSQVDPWATFHRFIVPYSLIRRPEYREPLLHHLGERARKSLLVLDEAHTIAPATQSKYAVDTDTTRAIRDIADRFEHRLFLSATPHNGHSNSFSALLEILDPQRFTRGVPVDDVQDLDPIMVRRLKSDLQAIGVDTFPERKVIEIVLDGDTTAWTARYGQGTGPTPIGAEEPFELTIAEKLREYAELVKPKQKRGRLVFVNLQKRLLSSVEAFHRTFRLHVRRVTDDPSLLEPDPEPEKADERLPLDHPLDPDVHGIGKDDRQDEEQAVDEGSRSIQTPAGRARDLLGELDKLARTWRAVPDAKTRALLQWIADHQCAATRVGGADTSTDTTWTDTRVIIFTEYEDTKRYLRRVLTTAISGTDRDDERIMEFHGSMSDEQREAVQVAFNGSPDEYPVRILLATDAAREGVNLQGHCADLFHFDLPWNPARIEQRNGRIDRTLQHAREVRCHYFVYPKRSEDAVLKKLVEKVEVIRRELGSLGTVVMDEVERAMHDDTISAMTATVIDAAGSDNKRAATVRRELEARRESLAALRVERETAATILERSRDVRYFRPELLRDAIDVGLELAGLPGLQPCEARSEGERPFYEMPDLGAAWERTLDTLRRPRGRDETFWEWRRRPVLPVTFHPLERLRSDAVHLHLEHPFVRRVLSRFRARGFERHGLSRVTIVRTEGDAIVRAIAFGRLSLFGPGAVRLHDELISVAARWMDSGDDAHLRPFADDADRRALERLEEALAMAPALEKVPVSVQSRLRDSAPTDFATLWPHIRDEADARADIVLRALANRGQEEGAALRKILERQRRAITNEIPKLLQLGLDLGPGTGDRAQHRQLEQDEAHMRRRLELIDDELETEPKAIESLYRVVLTRLEPVGLVYLWPATRG